MTPVEFMALFEEFRVPSWDGWRAILARLAPGVREFYGVIGRGAGKSRIVALLACWAASRAYPRAPGEAIYVGIFAPDRKQAGITYRYVLGLLRSVPELAALIVAEARDSVELANGVIVEVITASLAAPRGRAYALVIIEEAAFLPTDQSANPDVELLRAVRPALARVPGSLLAVVSSPYARKGVLYQAWVRYHGQPDGAVVLVQSATRALNPTFDAEAIATAFAEDPLAAGAEYDGQFRSDVAEYVSRDVVEACVVPGRYELPRQPGVGYRAFCDPSGGSGGDSFTLAIAHAEVRTGRRIAVLDAIREQRPPFSPEAVVTEFTAVLKNYGVDEVKGDAYAGAWPTEAFRKVGIVYRPAGKTKSAIYVDALPAFNAGAVELLDHPRLIAQLCGLERRTARGGRDSIDHAPHGRDDVVNSTAGVIEDLLVRLPGSGAVTIAILGSVYTTGPWWSGREPAGPAPPAPPRGMRWI
jgi:hypothetical protein